MFIIDFEKSSLSAIARISKITPSHGYYKYNAKKEYNNITIILVIFSPRVVYLLSSFLPIMMSLLCVCFIYVSHLPPVHLIS